VLKEAVLKLDHHLDAGNKDSLISAITHWVVEIGELDSSFKKDIARLKGFLTSDRDKVRRPYGRSDSEYPRRTVFCATVNDDNFLVDSTGNSRWWTIPVIAIIYRHDINMQQVFAQLATHLEDGMQWWLTSEEEALLELHNKKHRAVSVIRERILDALDLERIDESGLSAMTATQMLQSIDIKSPTNSQSKECASILRELLGEHKRIQGINKWRIPFKKEEWASANAPLVSDDGDVF
jgi:putative DNA primase/helicase